MSSDVRIDGREEGPAMFDAPDHVYEALAHPYRSTAIEVLRERRRPIAATDLAAWIVARVNDSPLVDVAESEHRTVLVALRHRHLPTLRDSGLVEWRPDEDAVSLADDAPVDSDRLGALLSVRTGRECDRFFEVLADARRRRVISILAHRDEATLTELAREVAGRELNADTEAVPESTVDRIRISLHHSHLPTMSAVDLLEYDRDETTVAYRGHPLLVSR